MVSLSFVAEGDVCPDLSIAAKGPDPSLYLDRWCSPWYKEQMEGIKEKTSLQSISLIWGSVFSSDYWYFSVHAVPECFPLHLGLSWGWVCMGLRVVVETTGFLFSASLIQAFAKGKSHGPYGKETHGLVKEKEDIVRVPPCSRWLSFVKLSRCCGFSIS